MKTPPGIFHSPGSVLGIDSGPAFDTCDVQGMASTKNMPLGENNFAAQVQLGRGSLSAAAVQAAPGAARRRG